ncbi:MAG: RNA polymerase-binding protein DksA [Thermodesulfobacteriota bacterium]|nr:RNA polymerase-binding protein DksA [Thermodesulfobacteriota bacterium]
MDSDKLEQFRELLQEKLNILLDEASRTITGMTSSNETFPDVTDRASLESDRNFLLRVRDRERKLILKIREALERIEGGTFGVCETCGGEISEKRLEARPVTTLCINCKTRQEEEEKTNSTKT